MKRLSSLLLILALIAASTLYAGSNPDADIVLLMQSTQVPDSLIQNYLGFQRLTDAPRLYVSEDELTCIVYNPPAFVPDTIYNFSGGKK